VDLNRDSLHSRFFFEFLLTHRLCCADVIKNLTTDYTHNFGMQRFSFIDHFVLLQNNADIIDNLYVAHDADNLSDHDPFFLSLSMNLCTVTLSQRYLNYRVACMV
jgi:hypothetical protein